MSIYIGIHYISSNQARLDIFNGPFPSNVTSISVESISFNSGNNITGLNITNYGMIIERSSTSSTSGSLYQLTSPENFSNQGGSVYSTAIWNGNPLTSDDLIAEMYVTYTTGGSGGGGGGGEGGSSSAYAVADKSYVLPGESITITVYGLPYGTVATATINSDVNNDSISAGAYINTDWAYQISTTTTIPSSWQEDLNAYFQLYLNNGDRVTLPIKISTPPQPISGNLNVSIVNPISGLCIQGYSDVEFSLNNSSPGTGAEYLSTIVYYGSSNRQTITPSPFIIEKISQIGELNCYATVTNNYNQTATTTTVILDVKEYIPPTIDFIQALRIDGQGTTDPEGEYIKVELSQTIFEWIVKENETQNSIQNIKIEYSSDQENWLTAEVLNSNPSLINFNNIENKIFQIDNSLLTEQLLYVKVTITDLVTSIESQIVETSLGNCTLYFDDGGENVSIGMFGTKRKALEINDDWNIYHGNNLVLDMGNIPVKKYPVTFQSQTSVSSGASMTFDVELLGTDMENMFYCGYSLGDITVKMGSSSYYPRFTVTVNTFYVEKNSTPEQSDNYYIYTTSTSKKIRITITNNSNAYWPEVSGTVYLLFIPFSFATPF